MQKLFAVLMKILKLTGKGDDVSKHLSWKAIQPRVTFL